MLAQPASSPQSRPSRRSERLAVLAPPARPTHRAACQDGPRPCPWVSCRYHLYLEVNEHGHIQLNHPGLEPDELDALPDTCALDVAERGPATLADVGQVLDRSPERVRQIESDALGRLARLAQPSSDPRLCPDAEILRELLDQEKPDA